MTSPRLLEGTLTVPKGTKFAIVATRFNGLIVEPLVQAALDAVKRHGGDESNVVVVRVPGAWELPVGVSRIAKKVDAVIALACVIRGATPHFDYVAGESAKGLQSVSLATGTPVAFGVLTTDTIEQALERAGTKAGNKGWDAAVTAIEMVNLVRAIEGFGS